MRRENVCNKLSIWFEKVWKEYLSNKCYCDCCIKRHNKL